MKNWQEHRFGDLVQFPPRIALKKGTTYPFIEMDAVNPCNRYVENPQCKKYESSSCSKFANGDVLLARITPCLENGKIAQVRITDSQGGFGSTEFFVFRAKTEVLDQSFLFYLTKCDLIWKSAVNSMVGASGRQRADAKFLKKVLVRIPKPAIQKKVAAILSTYDELIENNRRRIVLLERLAEEIYCEWFVRLRFPGHEKVGLVKGVPDGWGLKRFHEIVEYYIGGGWGEDDKSFSFSEGAFVIRGTDIPDVQAGVLDGCPFRFHKPSNLKSRTLQPNDFVFEVSGGSKDQLLGRNVMVTERVLQFLGAPVIAASFCKQIRFRSELVSPYFMKYFMKLYYDYDLVGIYQVQSTGISNYQFESFLKFQTIILPPDALQKQFEEKVKPIIEMRDDVALANIALRKTRDMLLPRLISGKLSVENLDIQFPPGMAEDLSAEKANPTYV
jgi:type I restriction enzyme S subunit